MLSFLDFAKGYFRRKRRLKKQMSELDPDYTGLVTLMLVSVIALVTILLFGVRAMLWR